MAEKVICIIDDNDDIRDIYRMKFKNEGFETVLASNGLDGLELIRTHHPGVVLLDIEMPKMNGIEVLQHIKADPSIQDIPVIILSNVDSADIFQQVMTWVVLSTTWSRRWFHSTKSSTQPSK